ncbi:FadR family transcriptional regulator [Candidimonas humi]|jgi:DNA-binding FadR family transcriptional regulator|uniref:FadR/GntR family transcriptional regulator n=1 Tax=Candidimonas humi TaxID=683355 RepID=A0ABV8NV94_9BURK|nr:FadR/GntR family transcriptional regulator [Candidimonas humi]MBV6303428.1 FadR family transcriptional regulator [Candidimonas humi]
MNNPRAERLLGDVVYEELTALLGSGELPPQSRLPSENELSQRLRVSRPVLRQALARLRAEGRISTRKGAGNYVADSSAATTPKVSFGPLTSIPDVRSFLEFRSSLEGEMAARAAVHHDRESLAEIGRRRRRLESAMAAGGDGIEEDIAFHAAIAQASGNRFFSMTMEALAEQTRFSIGLIRQLSDRPLALRMQDVYREHAAIEQAIASGDPAAARDAMTAHLVGGIARLFGK